MNANVSILQGEINGKQAAGNYVAGVNHGFAIYWTGARPGLSIDNADQGDLYCADWYRPMTIGALGNTLLVEQNETGSPGTLSAGIHCMGTLYPGTWMSCGGGQTSGNNWYAWLRVG